MFQNKASIAQKITYDLLSYRKVEEGLVFASDSRTNAGLDNIGSYTKMFTYNIGDRAFVPLTAGNLATSQAVYHQIEKDLENNTTEINLNLCEDIEAVADYVGKNKH